MLQLAGGGVYVHSSVLHLDRTMVRDNEAAEGGGVCLAAGSRLSASRSHLGSNRGSGSSSAAGADLLLADGDGSAAYMEPLPAADELSGGWHAPVACRAVWLGGWCRGSCAGGQHMSWPAVLRLLWACGRAMHSINAQHADPTMPHL